MSPLGHQKLVYLTPVGGFNFVFMVTFYVTMLCMMPFLLYQLYAFIRPAIPSHTRKLSVSVALAAMVLMVTGVSFAYIFVAPAGLDFLMHVAGNYVTPSLTADSYLNFILGYVFGIGLLFELPLLLMFWHWIHPLTPRGLLKSQRFAIAGAFILGAIISPSPDALSMTLIAVPLIVVYQFGVIAVLLSIRKKGHTTRQKAPVAPVKPSAMVAEPTIPLSASAHKPGPVELPVAPVRARSVDGVLKAPRTSYRPASAPVPARPLVVEPRPRLISDFGPARRPAIDTTR